MTAAFLVFSALLLAAGDADSGKKIMRREKKATNTRRSVTIDPHTQLANEVYTDGAGPVHTSSDADEGAFEEALEGGTKTIQRAKMVRRYCHWCASATHANGTHKYWDPDSIDEDNYCDASTMTPAFRSSFGSTTSMQIPDDSWSTITGDSGASTYCPIFSELAPDRTLNKQGAAWLATDDSHTSCSCLATMMNECLAITGSSMQCVVVKICDCPVCDQLKEQFGCNDDGFPSNPTMMEMNAKTTKAKKALEKAVELRKMLSNKDKATASALDNVAKNALDNSLQDKCSG